MNPEVTGSILLIILSGGVGGLLGWIFGKRAARRESRRRVWYIGPGGRLYRKRPEQYRRPLERHEDLWRDHDGRA